MPTAYLSHLLAHTSLFKSQWGTGTRHKRCPDWPPAGPEVGRENAIKQGTSVRAGPCGPETAAAGGHSHCAGPLCSAVGDARPPGLQYWKGGKLRQTERNEERRRLYSLDFYSNTRYSYHAMILSNCFALKWERNFSWERNRHLCSLSRRHFAFIFNTF